MKKQLLILMTLCTSALGFSQTTFIVNNITYTVTSATNNTVAVTDYNTNGGAVVIIPATVTPNLSSKPSTTNVTKARLATYTVTSIGNQAFLSKALTSVTIPSTVVTIGNNAFTANLLTGVIIPSNVTNIGGNAFTSNPLTCVSSLAVTPPTIFTGNGDSFANGDRSNIDFIKPAGTSIEYNTALWTGFKSSSEGLVLNSSFVVDNVKYRVTSTTNKTVAVAGFNTAGTTVLNIPSTVIGACTSDVYNVTSVAQTAFGNYDSLTSVTMPNSITSIGNYAFSNSGISSLTLSNALTTIADNSFSNNNLTSVNIPNGVTSIGIGAFNGNNISNLTIPNTVTTIGNYAFRGNQLTSVTIPSSVTSIGTTTFQNNPLTDIYAQGMTPATITTGSSNDTFSTIRNTIALHIPAGTSTGYVTGPNALWTGFMSVTEPTLSISDFEVTNDIKVITTTEAFKIVAPDSLQLQNYTVYSISGYEIASGIENEIPTTTLTKGIYVLKLNFDKGIVMKKVVK